MMKSGAAAALETHALYKTFGGVVATNNVDFRLETGARHALIGPNGAGKTTFVNLLTGLLTPSSGEILIAGQDATRWSSRRRTRAGVARTFQINQLFADFTSLETVLLVITERDGHGTRLLRPVGADRGAVEEAADLLDRLGLTETMHQPVDKLPYAKQRLLEIATALAAKPRIILLDEPAAGVPESERGQILDVIKALPDAVALLLIEHDMDLVFRFAERISVLANGALFAEGTPAEIGRDAGVRRIYLGEEALAHR